MNTKNIIIKLQNYLTNTSFKRAAVRNNRVQAYYIENERERCEKELSIAIDKLKVYIS